MSPRRPKPPRVRPVTLEVWFKNSEKSRKIHCYSIWVKKDGTIGAQVSNTEQPPHKWLWFPASGVQCYSTEEGHT